jgi:hypothetical protein
LINGDGHKGELDSSWETNGKEEVSVHAIKAEQPRGGKAVKSRCEASKRSEEQRR